MTHMKDVNKRLHRVDCWYKALADKIPLAEGNNNLWASGLHTENRNYPNLASNSIKNYNKPSAVHISFAGSKPD